MTSRKIPLNHLLSFSSKNQSLIKRFKNRGRFFGLLIILSLLIASPIIEIIKIILKQISSDKRKTEIVSWSFSLNQKKILDLLPFDHFHISTHEKTPYKIILYNILRYNINHLILIDIIKFYRKDEVKNNWLRLFKFLIIEPTLYERTKNIKKCVIANDHSLQNLYLIEFCLINDIKIIYIQHAPINDKFLPLKVDLAILYSQWAKDTYERQGKINKTIVKIVGDIPISILMESFKNSPTNNSILVCTNLLDNISRVIEFCNYLDKKSYSVMIRKHPADKRNWQKYGFKLSSNSLAADLNNSKFILVNESAVLLEAMALNKLVYKCNFSKPIDNYGFKKIGVLKKEFNTPEDLHLSLFISEHNYNQEELEYYTDKIKPIDDIIKNITQEIEML